MHNFISRALNDDVGAGAGAGPAGPVSRYTELLWMLLTIVCACLSGTY